MVPVDDDSVLLFMLTSHALELSDEPSVSCLAVSSHRHVVNDLSHSRVREETRDEHVGLRVVQLAVRDVDGLHGAIVLHGGADGEVTADVGVQDGSEQRRAVKVRVAAHQASIVHTRGKTRNRHKT